MKKTGNIVVKIATASVLFAVLLTSACKKDVPSNACDGKTAADASFKIYEKFLSDSTEADTVRNCCLYSFWAKPQSNTTYKWVIKSQNYYGAGTGSYLLVDNTHNVGNLLPAAEMYTVTLVVTKTNMGDCKSLKTIDSLSKRFYIWPCENGSTNCLHEDDYTLGQQMYYWPVWGRYKGSTKNDPNTIRIVTIFDTLDVVPNTTCSGQLAGQLGRCAILRNIPYNNWSNIKCSYGDGVYGSVAGPSGGATTAHIGTPQLPASSCCNGGQMPYIDGSGRLDVNNSKHIVVKYTYRDTLTGAMIYDEFDGWRIN